MIFLCSNGWINPSVFASQPRSHQTSATKLPGLKKDTRREKKERYRRKSGIKSQKKVRARQFFHCDPCAVTFQQSNQCLRAVFLLSPPPPSIKLASKTRRNGTNPTSIVCAFYKMPGSPNATFAIHHFCIIGWFPA